MELNTKKKEKRRNIAIDTIPLFLEKGIKNSSISDIAKNADIGKGTVYEYFENKEDIVFEIFDFFSEFLLDKFDEMLHSKISAKEKISMLLKSLVLQESEVRDVHPIFVEYYAISMTTNNDKIKAYNKKFFDNFLDVFKALVQEGLDSKEFKNQKALDVVHIFAAATDGILFYNQIIKDFKNEKNLDALLTVIFGFLESGTNKTGFKTSPYFF